MHDFLLHTPAILFHVDPRKPLCNGGGSPSAPPPPPVQPAPYRADSGGGEQAVTVAKRRQGLKKTILSERKMVPIAENTAATKLGETGNVMTSVGSNNMSGI